MILQGENHFVQDIIVMTQALSGKQGIGVVINGELEQRLTINKTINRHWRDWAGLVYLFICLCDFFIGPVVWNIRMDSYCNMMVAKDLVCDASRWTPLTLEGGAMFHISFGAILGATAWKKKDELEIHHRNGSNSSS